MKFVPFLIILVACQSTGYRNPDLKKCQASGDMRKIIEVQDDKKYMAITDAKKYAAEANACQAHLYATIEHNRIIYNQATDIRTSIITDAIVFLAGAVVAVLAIF